MATSPPQHLPSQGPPTPDCTPDLGNTLPLDSQISHPAQLDYWSSQTADVTGMLGGYPQVSRIDLQGSKTFIAKIRRLSRPINPQRQSQQQSSTALTPPTKRLRRAVDCGAGIGRITSGLLLNVADTVDIVEPVSKFTDELRKLTPGSEQGVVGEVFVQGLESWSPSPETKYDLIWNQWCLGHLTDRQVVEYLRRAATSLAGCGADSDTEPVHGLGWIMVKENLSTDAFGEDLFDDVDSSVTRSDAKFRALFEEAELRIVKMEVQSGFPKSLYPIKMYALRPK